MSRARFFARRAAVQALYQLQLNGGTMADIAHQFEQNPTLPTLDSAYFKALIFGVVEERTALDEVLKPHCRIPLEELDPVERAILWTAAFELKERLDTPYRVVINEAVELAKHFGADESYTFVNGVLDALARELRTLETTPD